MMYLPDHLRRLIHCLDEAVAFASATSPGTGHNAGMWHAAITEAQAALAGQEQGGVRVRCRCGGDWVFLQAALPQGGFRWLDALSGRIVDHCPACGAPTSLLSMKAEG